MVRLRGLPYSAQEKDIRDFFQPLVPLRVNMDFDQFGRPSGEAEVFFQSHEDAQTAMKKNNQHIGKCVIVSLYLCPFSCVVCVCVTLLTAGCFCVGPRYIELFLHSTEDSGGPQGGVGGGVAGGIKYGQQPQAQQGWGDNRAQVGI